MTDAAYQNAKAKLIAVSEERTTLRARLAELDKEAVRAERFIAEWEEWAGVQSASQRLKTELRDQSTEVRQVKSRPKNPSKEEVATAASRVVVEEGRPMGRADLYQALKAKGIELQGADPVVVLSTMLWRMRDVIPYYKGVGYWPAGVPAPAGLTLREGQRMEHAVQKAGVVFHGGRPAVTKSEPPR